MGMRPYTYELKMDPDSESVLDFAEEFLHIVIAEVDQASDDRLYEIIDMGCQVLQCAILMESMSHLVSPFVESLRELLQQMTFVSDQSSTCIGRPRVAIEEDQIRFLVENGFRINDIAAIFGCCRRTIERRLHDFQISPNAYSSISDASLDEMVESVTSLHPKCGEKTINGRLRSQGICVQRERIRESLRRVDPSGVQLRARRVLHRRQYGVECPNALWHLDGYHKLIRWRIVIHGAIDGYSRLITFLKASTNNLASTVLSAFTMAVDHFGLPSHIRIDQGGENVLVSQYMLEHPSRGCGRSSVISGRSVHNQRIERLWRDLYSGCVCLFYSFFYFLEDTGLLNISDPFDLYALHFVFMPVIQKQVDLFKEGWAHHKLRTEGNRTPQQLWIMGLNNMASQNPDHAAVTGISVSVPLVS